MSRLTLAALLGLQTLFALFPWAYAAFKTVGALYLIYLAWKTWRAAHNPTSTAPHPAARAFLGGILVNLANPKSVTRGWPWLSNKPSRRRR